MRSRFSVMKKYILGIMLLPVAVNGAVLEEVVVTAQKREENIRDVGISITALSGDSLEALGLDDMQKSTMS